MDKSFIQEAFKQVYLTEDAEEFSLNVSGPNDTESFMDIINSDEYNEDEMISDVYDLEAEAKEDLKQSYIGKVILDCNVCHSNVFFNKDEITENEDGICCEEIECPYCMSNEGYTIIGEVKPYQEEEDVDIDDIESAEIPEGEPEIEEEVPEEEPVEDTEEDEEGLEEGLKADEVKELRGNEEINGADGPIPAVDELEGSDEIRGPKYTELNEDCVNCEEELEEGCSKEELEECGEPGLVEGCDKELTEDIEDVSINTEDENITMTTKEDGGVVVETSPKEEFDDESVEEFSGDEMIAPLEPETESDVEDAIEVNTDSEETPEDEMLDELPEEEEFSEEGEEELAPEDEFEEFDEESFNGLGESYLKRCYENVTSFKTSNITLNENKEFVIEGKIGFDSGNKKDTQFVFSTKSNENGKLKLEGYNKQISKGKKTFKLNCSVNDKSLICESLNYNYKGKNDLNESVRVYGTVKRK